MSEPKRVRFLKPRSIYPEPRNDVPVPCIEIAVSLEWMKAKPLASGRITAIEALLFAAALNEAAVRVIDYEARMRAAKAATDGA